MRDRCQGSRRKPALIRTLAVRWGSCRISAQGNDRACRLCPRSGAALGLLIMVSILSNCNGPASRPYLMQRVQGEQRRQGPVDADGNRIPNNPAREREFRDFWKGFRKAVLRSDWDELASLVEFPLSTRASMDWDPVIPVHREDFQERFSEFLVREKPLIERLPRIDPYIVDDWVRIGDMQFRRRGGQWKLYWIYI